MEERCRKRPTCSPNSTIPILGYQYRYLLWGGPRSPHAITWVSTPRRRVLNWCLDLNMSTLAPTQLLGAGWVCQRSSRRGCEQRCSARASYWNTHTVQGHNALPSYRTCLWPHRKRGWMPEIRLLPLVVLLTAARRHQEGCAVRDVRLPKMRSWYPSNAHITRSP